MINAIQHASTKQPLPSLIHQKLNDLFIRFQIIGGMPKVVLSYVESGSFTEAQKILATIANEYESDFSKYKKRLPAYRLTSVFKDVASQTGNKFSFKTQAKYYTYPQIHECLDFLKMAGLIIPIYHTAANGLPLGASINPKLVKYLVFDTGIYLHLIESNITEILYADHDLLINKGGLADLSVGLELIKNSPAHQLPQIYFWQREKIGSQAEVDYVKMVNNKITPIEVKSSSKGAMKSLYLFLKEKDVNRGMRISKENFNELDKVDVYPIYATANLT